MLNNRISEEAKLMQVSGEPGRHRAQYEPYHQLNDMIRRQHFARHAIYYTESKVPIITETNLSNVVLIDDDQLLVTMDATGEHA